MKNFTDMVLLSFFPTQARIMGMSWSRQWNSSWFWDPISIVVVGENWALDGVLFTHMQSTFGLQHSILETPFYTCCCSLPTKMCLVVATKNCAGSINIFEVINEGCGCFFVMPNSEGWKVAFNFSAHHEFRVGHKFPCVVPPKSMVLPASALGQLLFALMGH